MRLIDASAIGLTQNQTISAPTENGKKVLSDGC